MEVDPSGFRVERTLGWPSEDAETSRFAPRSGDLGRRREAAK
jgi:hypothetical protein